MLNKLWAGMILIGILFGAINGRMAEITNGMLEASKEAITLCITMMGVMSFWMGMMEVATQAGVIQVMAKKISPIVHFLFPNIPKEHKAAEYITTNIIANILGLGWAATPAGLKAMEELGKLEDERRSLNSCTYKKCSGETILNESEEDTAGKRYFTARDTASDEMCTFLVINISSLQLIPVNIIAYRSQYGSVNPAAIVGPGIVATAVSTIVAVVFCKMMCGRKKG